MGGLSYAPQFQNLYSLVTRLTNTNNTTPADRLRLTIPAGVMRVGSVLQVDWSAAVNVGTTPISVCQCRLARTAPGVASAGSYIAGLRIVANSKWVRGRVRLLLQSETTLTNEAGESSWVWADTAGDGAVSQVVPAGVASYATAPWDLVVVMWSNNAADSWNLRSFNVKIERNALAGS